MSDSGPERPIVSVTISSTLSDGGIRLLESLREIARNDLALRIETETTEGGVRLEGKSESHLKSISDRLKEDYDLEIEASPPTVIYLETIRKSAEGEGKYIRQTGGSGNYAHCKLLIEPNDPGIGNQFIHGIRAGVLPEIFLTAIETGVQNALKTGILAGCPMTDVKITLRDGSFHETDSNEMAFRFAGSIAFREAARKAGPVLMEPVMNVEIKVPESLMGPAIQDVNSRRGRIVQMERVEGSQVINATVPLAEMLSSSPHGCPEYPMRFAGYQPARGGGLSGEETSGVPAIKPRVPNLGRDSAAASLSSDSE